MAASTGIRPPVHFTALLLAAVLAALSLLPGCGKTSYFPEFLYPDTEIAVNLVANLSFSDWALDPTLSALGTAASLYVNFEPSTEVTPPVVADLPEVSSEVYRLEYKSLIPDGDFSSETAGPVAALGDPTAGWRFYPSEARGGTGTQEVVDGTDTHSISDKTLHFATLDDTSRLDFAIRDPDTGVLDGFLQDASYLVRFSYRSADKPVVFEFRDDTQPIYTWLFHSGTDGSSTGASLSNIVEFPPSIVLDPPAGSGITSYATIQPGSDAAYHFTFGSLIHASSDIQDAYIDNFRLVRTDILPRVELRLARELSLNVIGNDNAWYSLESGIYWFSVWIHDDPAVGSKDGPQYQCSAVTVTIAAGDIEGSGSSSVGSDTYVETVTRGTDGFWPGADSDGWACITLPMTESAQITTPDNPDAAVMVVTISPTDWYSAGGLDSDAGSILISAPMIQFATAVPPAP